LIWTSPHKKKTLGKSWRHSNQKYRGNRAYREAIGSKNDLERVVRGTVEETLNAFLDAEADRLCNAQRYERRRDTRAGYYERKLQTKAGEVERRVPKLRQQTP
jgi:transposase-like protein